MSVLKRASFGFLLRHPVQLLLALLGIATGVAVIVAVDLANHSAKTSFQDSVVAITGTATHHIIGGPGGLDDALYTELRVEHGVARIAPVVEGIADYESSTFQVLGVDPFAEREFRSYALQLGDGGREQFIQLLIQPGAVLLSTDTAADLGLAIGTSFELRVEGVRQSAVLVGSFDGSAQPALRDLLVTDIATAQDWYQLRGGLTRIDVRVKDELEADRLRTLLSAGVQLLDAASRSISMLAMSRAFFVNLTAMSLLALLVGVFLIYNAVSFTVMQRRSLISILRALGLTRAELFRLIVTEALLLGVVGSLLGLLIGVQLGQFLLGLVSQSLSDLYFQNSVSSYILSDASLLKGFAAGLLATLFAALVPAVEAVSYPPHLGMQRALLERKTVATSWKLLIAGLLLALCVYPLLKYSDKSLVAGLVSLFLLIIGIALCVPFVMRGVLAVLAAIAGAIGGRLTRLSIAGIAASLSRTGLAVVALCVAVSATVGVGIMVGSFRLAVSDWVEHTLQADIYVSPVRGSLQSRLLRDIRAIPGIVDTSTSRRVWLESGEQRTRLITLNMAPRSYDGIELIDKMSNDIWPAFNQTGAVLISESYSYRFGAEPGDVVTLPSDRGERAFQVAATYRSYDAQAEAIIMARPIYNMFWDDDAVDGVGLYLQNDADSSAVAAAVRALAEGGQSLQVRSNAELKELSLAVFDRTFIITNVLYWLAVCVAITGILAALLALQMERSRELATLRALGVTRLQLGGMVTLQSGVIGMVSGLFALPLGILMSVLLIDIINRRAFGWSMPVVIDPTVLTSAVLMATGAALLAGLYPAWRAGHSQPALAMREE